MPASIFVGLPSVGLRKYTILYVAQTGEHIFYVTILVVLLEIHTSFQQSTVNPFGNMSDTKFIAAEITRSYWLKLVELVKLVGTITQY